MRWFLRYCDNSVFSTCAVRPDVRRLDADEHDLEVALWANAVPWLAARVPNRAGVAGMAKPSSIMAILMPLLVRREPPRAHWWRLLVSFIFIFL